MPGKGTQNTPIRFTEADKADIAVIQKHMGGCTLAEAVREAVTFMRSQLPIKPQEKTSRKSRKTT